MEMKRKRIALFSSNLTGRYRRDLSRAFCIAAEELNLDLVIFNTYGRIGNWNSLDEDYESELFEYIDLNQFDGIVFDGEGHNLVGMSDKIERILRTAKCAVVSISSYVEGFYNIEFEDAGGMRAIVEHFIEHHHFTKIGFMSGPLSHPDAQVRLKEFQVVMKEHGLPENGVGVFEGDFWYRKGADAANYFLSLPERPEAIVCANDYMAVALGPELVDRGVKVPEDIAISGYDGTVEGQENLPHLTTVTRERLDIARKSLKLLADLAQGRSCENADLRVVPKVIYSQSCGCEPLDYKKVLRTVARLNNENRVKDANTSDVESALLRLSKIDDLKGMEKVFRENSVNFGSYSSFFMMLYVDEQGRLASDSDFSAPSGKFQPVVWIDNNKEYVNSPREFSSSSLLPESDSDRCHTHYIMTVHCAGKIFGYAVIEMNGKELFSEFYKVWLLNMGIVISSLQKNDHIAKLINVLENMSIRDGLTGLLNRRGFDDTTRDMIKEFYSKRLVCTMVIDMDGLKHINDVYGHSEGDRAIKALGEAIMKAGDCGEIVGRAGGDEFYIFAVDYSEIRLNKFLEHLTALTDEFNRSNEKGYLLEFSYGAYLTETDSYGRIEEFLKVSDGRMYEQKMTKPGRRR